MFRRYSVWIGGVVVVVAVVAAILVGGPALRATPSQAQQPPGTPIPVPVPIPLQTFVYSVKFVCGQQIPPVPVTEGQAGNEPPVKPGNYATAVNIHNFQNTEVRFTKKAVVALPQNPDDRRGPISPRVREALLPDQALEVDCRNIVDLFNTAAGNPVGNAPFLKGFVVVESRVKLDIAAVYTAEVVQTIQPGIVPQPSGISIDVEYIQPQTRSLVPPPLPRGSESESDTP